MCFRLLRSFKENHTKIAYKCCCCCLLFKKIERRWENYSPNMALWCYTSWYHIELAVTLSQWKRMTGGSFSEDNNDVDDDGDDKHFNILLSQSNTHSPQTVNKRVVTLPPFNHHPHQHNHRCPYMWCLKPNQSLLCRSLAFSLIATQHFFLARFSAVMHKNDKIYVYFMKWFRKKDRRTKKEVYKYKNVTCMALYLYAQDTAHLCNMCAYGLFSFFFFT